MYKFIFTKKSEKEFRKLDIVFQNRIIEKLKTLKTSLNIFNYLNHLENLPPFTHRLRVGNMRLLLKQNDKYKNIFYILKTGKRGDIYK